MVKTLTVATRNCGKLKEIKELLSDLPVEVKSLADYADLPEIVEDGKTFEENAKIKALTISRTVDGLVVGEDSGLEVDALEGRPGIYSARYAKDNATDEENNIKLLAEMDGVSQDDRSARYQCAAVLSEGDEIIASVCGTCEGLIAFEPKGNNGFGYDPLFFVAEHNGTFGELDPSIKAQLSHRAQAMKKVREELVDYFQENM